MEASHTYTQINTYIYKRILQTKHAKGEALQIKLWGFDETSQRDLSALLSVTVAKQVRLKTTLLVSSCSTHSLTSLSHQMVGQPNKPVPPNGGNGLSRLEWVDTPNSSIHPLSLITKSARENMHVGGMHAHAHRSTHLRVLSLDWLWINEASFQLPKAAPEH